MMEKISKNNTQYVFTLNPNKKNISNSVEGQYLLHQLKAKNILDVCLMKKDGFDIIFEFSCFAKIYCVLVKGLSEMYRNSVAYTTEWRTIKCNKNIKNSYHSRKRFPIKNITAHNCTNDASIFNKKAAPILNLDANNISTSIDISKNKNSSAFGFGNDDNEKYGIQKKTNTINDDKKNKEKLVEISSKEVCQCILSFLTENGQIKCTSWKIENSKIFIKKVNDLLNLKKILNNVLINHIRSIQLFWRYFVKKKRKRIVLINDKIKLQLIMCQKQEILKKQSALKIQNLFRGTKTREVSTKYFNIKCIDLGLNLYELKIKY